MSLNFNLETICLALAADNKFISINLEYVLEIMRKLKIKEEIIKWYFKNQFLESDINFETCCVDIYDHNS